MERESFYSSCGSGFCFNILCDYTCTVLPRFFVTLYNATLAYRQQITQTRFPTMITPPLERPPLFGYRQT